MRFQAGIQIILLITSVVIVFTVIKPKFAMISQTQAEAVAYKDAVDNIGQYNARLQSLMDQASSISAENLAALYRYLPEEVDTVAVGRDIVNIAEENNLLLVDVTPGDPEAMETEMPEGTGEPIGADSVTGEDPDALDSGTVVDNSANTRPLALSSLTFEVKVVGNYDDMKSMLQDLERNDYPLQVVEFSFALDEEGGDLIEYSMKLRTYSLAFRE